MELDKLNKYVHMTQLADCVEVMFAGVPCLSVFEGQNGYYWRINPFFAKLTYGADVFNDVPYCSENFDMLEAAIATGLEKLHDLGAFRNEIDLPEDTYAAEHLDESIEQVDELSNDTLASYKKKAGEYARSADKAADISFAAGETALGQRWTKRANKKFSGVVKATNKQFVNDAKNESIEELDEGAINDAENKLRAHALVKIEHETKFGQMSAPDLHQHEVIRNQLLKQKKTAQSSYNKRVNNESVEELDEAAFGKQFKDAQDGKSKQSDGRINTVSDAQRRKNQLAANKKALAGAKKGYPKRTDESEEQIDELSDLVKHSYVAKAARNRDELDDRLTAIKDSGANVKTDKIEKKLQKREDGMSKVVSRIPKEVAYSIKEDCRREAMKHCDTLMEAQDLAEGLFESFMEDLDEVKSDVVTTYDKEKSTNTAKTEQGKKSLYKQVVQSQKQPKTNQWKVKESVEELGEAVVKITTVDGNKALRPGTKHEHQVIFNHGEFKAENVAHKGATVHTVKQPNEFHGVLVVKDKAILASNQNNMTKDDALKIGQHLTKSGFVGASKYGIHLGSTGSSVHKIEHANESVDEAYGTTKKAYDPFASAISKVMARPAFSAITKDEPEKAPAAKKTGRPTNIDLDSIKSKAADNVKAGKRPTAGMERNEKIHFVRHLKDHPDFTGTHVSAAGRAHGTNKEEMTKRKDAVKATKVDNVMANWMR